MDVILHIGAHRCATTSFQAYMRRNAAKLEQDGIGFWGPRRMRGGLSSGLLPGPRVFNGRAMTQRAIGRIRINLDDCKQWLKTLVVSDENMLGMMRANVRTADLYGGAGERMARFHAAFGDCASDAILNIRSPECYWASVLGHGVARGWGVPNDRQLARLADNRRSWRDVITDVACALPGTRIWVLPHEIFAGRPETQLAAVAAVSTPGTFARDRLNATPALPALRDAAGAEQAAHLPQGEGRWQPFSAEQIAVFRESYADDLMWLAGGADGLAWLMDDPDKKGTGANLPSTDKTRGRPNDNQERRMEGAG